MARRANWQACVLAGMCFVTACATSSALQRDKGRISRQLGEGYLAEGNLSAALRELLKAKALYDGDPFLHYDLGLIYSGQEQFQLSIDHLQKAQSLKADYSEAQNALGTVYLRLEKWDQAIEMFERARSNLLYSTPHIVLNNLGDAYRGKKEYLRAIALYKKALEKEPQFPYAHRGIGLALAAMGEAADAETALKKAIEFSPRFASAHFDLGCLYVSESRKQEAVAAFKMVIELAPSSAQADMAVAQIKKLEDLPSSR